MSERCFWCNADPDEAAARHEGPHATWCPHFRMTYRRREGTLAEILAEVEATFTIQPTAPHGAASPEMEAPSASAPAGR